MKKDNIPYKLAEWLSFNPAKIIKATKVVYPMEFLQTLQFWISIKVSNMMYRKAYLYPNNPFDGQLFAACVEKTFCLLKSMEI